MSFASLLFGDGFAPAAAISDSGLSNWIGEQLSVVAAAPSAPPPLPALPESPFSRVEQNLRQLHQRLHRVDTGDQAA